MAAGFTYKRCSCPATVSESGRPLARKSKHGSWYFAAETRDEAGKRRQDRRGGFATQAEAQAALTAFAQTVNEGTWTDDRNQTVKTYLQAWLDMKIDNGLRPTTARGYRMHIAGYITPVIGHRLGIRPDRDHQGHDRDPAGGGSADLLGGVGHRDHRR